MEPPIEIRELALNELSRVGEIDRTERIDVIFEQHGTELVARSGTWAASAWDPGGEGEHSVESHRQTLAQYVNAGGVVRGAFSDGRLVGSRPSRHTDLRSVLARYRHPIAVSAHASAW